MVKTNEGSASERAICDEGGGRMGLVVGEGRWRSASSAACVGVRVGAASASSLGSATHRSRKVLVEVLLDDLVVLVGEAHVLFFGACVCVGGEEGAARGSDRESG